MERWKFWHRVELKMICYWVGRRLCTLPHCDVISHLLCALLTWHERQMDVCSNGRANICSAIKVPAPPTSCDWDCRFAAIIRIWRSEAAALSLVAAVVRWKHSTSHAQRWSDKSVGQVALRVRCVSWRNKLFEESLLLLRRNPVHKILCLGFVDSWFK